MNIASLFNLAGPDLIIILLIVLLLFGAKKLPELARGMGQAVREFSKAKDELEGEVTRPPETTDPPVVTATLGQPPVDVAHDPHAQDPHANDPHASQTTPATPHSHV